MIPVKTLGLNEGAVDAQSSPRRSRGLVSKVLSALELDIREGRLQVGEKLPTESALVTRFDVSRTVVREAISKLQAGGLVQTKHGIGTFVTEPVAKEANFKIAAEDLATVADVISLLELRISLESESASLAARRRTNENLDKLRAALAAFAASIQQDSDAVPSDFQFHMEVAQATGNRHFADLMLYLGTVIIPRTRLKTAVDAPEGRLAYLERVHREHEAIFAAIAAQDADAARAAMRVHLTNSRNRLRHAHVLAPVEMS